MRISAYHILDWDSKTFGYTVANIDKKKLSKNELDVLLLEMKKEKIKLAYWFVDPSDNIINAAAVTSGGFLADEKITFAQSLLGEVFVERDENILSYLHVPINESLSSLVLQSGVCSRFKIDPKFVFGEYEKLYRLWLEKSIGGEKAHEVLVFVKENKEIGLITLEKRESSVAIGLFAVDAKHRGLHIGTKLISAIFHKTKEWGYNVIEVTTQKKNTIACRFYEKNGFTFKSQQNVYHFWL